MARHYSVSKVVEHYKSIITIYRFCGRKRTAMAVARGIRNTHRYLETRRLEALEWIIIC